MSLFNLPNFILFPPFFNPPITLLLLLAIVPHPAHSAITVADLLPGDVVFYMEPSSRGLLSPHHVALFSKAEENGAAQVVHAVTVPYNSIVATQIVPSLGQSFAVFRNTNFKLAVDALYRMNIWAHHRVAYDHQKISYLSNDLKSKNTEQLYLYARAQSVPNFYRRIKYASRNVLPNLPSNSKIGSSGRGFQCAEAVTVAYQSEELADHVVHGFSSQLDPEQELWLSDKYVDPKLLDGLKVSDAYRDYLKRLQSQREYEVRNTAKKLSRNHRLYFPSIIAWDFENFGPVEEFAQDFNTCLPLDSKLARVDVLFHHLQNTPEHWEALGLLELEKPKRTEHEKREWKERIADSSTAAKGTKDRFAQRLVGQKRKRDQDIKTFLSHILVRQSLGEDVGEVEQKLKDLHRRRAQIYSTPIRTLKKSTPGSSIYGTPERPLSLKRRKLLGADEIGAGLGDERQQSLLGPRPPRVDALLLQALRDDEDSSD